MMSETSRVKVLNEKPIISDGEYVLYWMQQSQREPMNPALEYGARAANDLKLPLVAAFGLDNGYPDANERHFAFMLQGLAETTDRLLQRGVKLIGRLAAPPRAVEELAAKAALVVCDRGYLRHQRQWRQDLASCVACRVVQVEGDVVVPVETASDKREWAARTLRKKIGDQFDRFVSEITPTRLDKSSLPLKIKSDIDFRRWQKVLDDLDIDREVRHVSRFRGGTGEARKRLTAFLRSDLPGYAEARNDPSDPQASELSPYLHFGQLSPVEIAIKVQRSKAASDKDKKAFLEELIVRRELACNFVFYTSNYDSFTCLPDWARKTLAEHKSDERPTRYTRKQLETAQTDDRYWNAAMQEMLETGYMHNHMRMYWGKKILEWSNTPQYAYATALYLNNKYFLDGRDPNSYSNVAWIFGLHDQAWAERAIFGKVRYMNAGGLERKFDIEKYVNRIDKLTEAD
jgi:deoxyribodipyrimidine photo-lyase